MFILKTRIAKYKYLKYFNVYYFKLSEKMDKNKKFIGKIKINIFRGKPRREV
jgi:hypothetical protein